MLLFKEWINSGFDFAFGMKFAGIPFLCVSNEGKYYLFNFNKDSIYAHLGSVLWEDDTYFYIGYSSDETYYRLKTDENQVQFTKRNFNLKIKEAREWVKKNISEPLLKINKDNNFKNLYFETLKSDNPEIIGAYMIDSGYDVLGEWMNDVTPRKIPNCIYESWREEIRFLIPQRWMIKTLNEIFK